MSLDAGRVGVRADQVDVHGRVTSPSFLNELLEDLPEWTDMPVWVNGTEEVLPSNTSVPVTSPILADIAYPDIRRDNQYFTYRESPTPVDGLAKIKSIKGNTLGWNQLVQNGNFADSSNWYARQSTFTVSDNIATVTPSTEGTERGMYNLAFPVKANHKYLLSCEVKLPIQSTARVSFGGSINYGFDTVIQANQWNKCQGIVLNDTDRNIGFYSLIRNSLTPSQTIQFRNMMVIDLTQMGLDISSPSDFTSLFPLSYYSYNQGSLLSFNGNGIKSVGKNLVFKTIPNSSINGSGVIISTSNFQMSVAPVIKGKEYVITTNDNSKKVLGFFYEEPVVGSASYNGERIDDSSSYTFTSPITGYVAFRSLGGYSTPMLEFGSVASDYEPYTSSTLSLPISTYFPNGMKSAGTVYDELTPRKAITRIGAVNLGSLDWSYVTIGSVLAPYFMASFSGIKSQGNPAVNKANILCPKYQTVARNDTNFVDKTICADGSITEITQIQIKDSSYADATAFKTAMDGVYLYYELATPVELPTLSLGE